MKKILKKIGFLLALAVLLGAVPEMAGAEEAVGRITLTECDLNTKQPVSGISLAVYQVAVADPSGKGVVYTGEFAGISSGSMKLSESFLTDGDHQTENTQKLDQYVANHSDIRPLQTAVTDANGRITFENLPDGVYFFRQINPSDGIQENGTRVKAYSFFISLPVTVNGVSSRTITDAVPKCLVEPIPEKAEVRVYKVWKDNSNKAGKRPENIQVELLDRGIRTDKQILSDENNWSYCWAGLEAAGHEWSVRELMVPDGYTSEVKQEGYNFTITNTISKTPPSSPNGSSRTGRYTSSVKTGDSGHMLFWIFMTAIAAAGIALLLLRRRRSKV